MIRGAGHIGVAVKDIEASLNAFVKIVGCVKPEIKSVTEVKMKFAVIDLEGISVEFVQDDNEDGFLSRDVRKKGDHIHHFCLLSDDIDEDVRKLQSRGVEMMDQRPKVGLRGKRIALTAPDAFNGIPIELSEP